MAWSLVGSGSASVVASGDVTPGLPAGLAQNDILVAVIAARGNAAFTAPAGWTIAEQQSSGDTLTTTSGTASCVLAYCIRGASDPASTTFTRTGGDLGLSRITAYRSSVSGTPTVGPSNSATDGSSGTSHSLTGITTANAGALIVALCAGGNNDLFSAFSAASMSASATGAASAGTVDANDPSTTQWYRRGNVTTATGADGSVYHVDAVQSSAGATGSFSVTSAAANKSALAAMAFYEPASLNNYSLTAAAGSFALSGQAASLKAGRSVTAAAGSFSLSGQSATLKAGRVLVSAAGSFTLSGQPATLYRAITLTAGAGSFTLSGQAASFGLTRTLSAGAGSYSLSGQAAAFAVTRVLSAGTGAFTLTGKAATLTRTGSYSLTCDTGDFTLSGQAAGLAATRLLTAGAGSFTLSGQAASLTAARTLAAGTGDFTLAGQAAGLTYTPNAGAYTLSAEAGVFTLNGQAAALAYVSNEAATQPTGGGGEFKPSKRLRQIERQRQKARKRLDDYLTRAFDLVDGVAPESEAPEPVAEQVIEQLAVMPDPEALRLMAGIRAELAAMRQHAETLARIEAEQARLRDDDDAIIALLLAA